MGFFFSYPLFYELCRQLSLGEVFPQTWDDESFMYFWLLPNQLFQEMVTIYAQSDNDFSQISPQI